MDSNINRENCTRDKRKKNSDNIKFSVAFSDNGESFQNIIEKILISKLSNKINND